MSALHSFSDCHRECLLPDSVMSKAYESLTGAERAVLKKCIARLHVVWGEHALRHKEIKQFRQGFSLELSSTPSPFALFVCPACYASPAAFLAGILPAMLAGVPRILPFFVVEPGRENGCPDDGRSAALDGPLVVSPFLVAAMELAGVEEVYAGTAEQAVDIASALIGEFGASGRIALFGNLSCMQGIASLAASTATRLHFFPENPHFYSTVLHTVTRQQIEGNTPIEEKICEGVCALSKESMQLFLDEDHEQIWIWPDFGPDVFRVPRMKVYS